MQIKMAVVGPLVSLSMAALCVLTIVGAAPAFNLLARPLITPAHLIRSFVWLNAFLGALHLLPAYPLDAGRVLRSQFTRVQGRVQAARAAAGLGLMIGVIAILLGILLPNMWLATAGFLHLHRRAAGGPGSGVSERGGHGAHARHHADGFLAAVAVGHAGGCAGEGHPLAAG